jgi:twinkle protein
VQDYFKNDIYGGISLPFDFTDDKFKIRFGETSIITGYSGHGKTAWLSYVMLKILNENKTLIASFEMLPKASLGRMLLQNNLKDPTDQAITNFVQGLDEKLYLYDAEGETSVEKIISVIFYSAEKLGVKIFVIDSLMKCGINEDDYNKQKKFINQLCVASRDLNIKIFLVCHSRKTFNEHGEPSKFDVLGSSNITNLADNCITIFRNKAKEEILNSDNDEKKADAINWYDAQVFINKQRHGNGYEGKFGLYFDKETFRFSTQNFNKKAFF